MRVQLTLAHVADAFGVEPSAVRGWVRDGDLPCTDDRGHLTFDRAEVVAWAAQRGLLAKAGALAVQHPGGGSAPVLSGLLRTGGIWRDVPPDRAIETLEAAAARLPGATVAVGRLTRALLRDDLRQLLMDGAPDATIFTALAEHDAAIEAGASIAQRPERAKP